MKLYALVAERDLAALGTFLDSDLPEEPNSDAIEIVEDTVAKLKRRNELLIPSLYDLSKSGDVRLGLQEGKQKDISKKIIKQLATKVAKKNSELIPASGEIDSCFFGFQNHALSKKYVLYPDPRFKHFQQGTLTTAVIPVMVSFVKSRRQRCFCLEMKSCYCLNFRIALNLPSLEYRS